MKADLAKDSPIEQTEIRKMLLNSYIADMTKYAPVYAIRISARNFGMVNGIKAVPLYSVFCI